MWIGMYLIFVLIALGVGWVVATQIFIPVFTDRPLFPIFTVGRAQHDVAAAREDKLVAQLHGQEEILKSETNVLHKTVYDGLDEIQDTIEAQSDGDGEEWRVACFVIIQRLKTAIETH